MSTKLSGTAVSGNPLVNDVSLMVCRIPTSSVINGLERTYKQWQRERMGGRTADEEPEVGEARKLLEQANRHEGHHIVPAGGK